MKPNAVTVRAADADLPLAGEKASGEFLIKQGRPVATNVTGAIVRGSGHWLMELAPGQAGAEFVGFQPVVTRAAGAAAAAAPMS